MVQDYKDKKRTRIGLVNTELTEIQVMNCLVNPQEGITQSKKQRLYRILNLAREENVDYLVFPEFYMPVIWLNDIAKFVKQYGITIVTGVQYIVSGKRAYNTVCVVKSVCGKHKFRNSIPLFRKKNHYAPNEQIFLAQLGFECKDQTKPYYYLIKN